MVPSLEHVMKKRHHNRRRLRWTALVLCVIAVIFAAMGLGWTLLSEDRDWSGLRGWAAIAIGIATPALPLWVFDGVLSRALVPIPGGDCPVCRYDLTGLESGVCPECGIEVPAGVV